MISGERIRLRAIEPDDLSIFQSWLNDPQVRMGLSTYLPFSLEEEKAWYEAMLRRPSEEHPLLIEIPQEDTWRPIGNCGFQDVNWKVRSAEFGIVIGEKEVWGEGYGTEATRMMVDHGFRDLNLNRIYLRVLQNNPRAMRVYEKVGFTHEGRMRQADYKDGRYLDVFYMGILRSEWEEKKNADDT